MSYRFEDRFRAGPGWNCSSILVLLYVFLAEEQPETRRVSCQNKFVNLVHLVGFIIKKFVTMYGHMNVKNVENSVWWLHIQSGQCCVGVSCMQVGCEYICCAFLGVDNKLFK